MALLSVVLQRLGTPVTYIIITMLELVPLYIVAVRLAECFRDHGISLQYVQIALWNLKGPFANFQLITPVTPKTLCLTRMRHIPSFLDAE